MSKTHRRDACATTDFRPGFIGTLYGIAVDKRNFRLFFPAKISRFPGPGNVMRAMDDGLHLAEPRDARRADLLLGEIGGRQRDVGIAAFVKGKCWSAGLRTGAFLRRATVTRRFGDRGSALETGTDNFAFKRE